MSKYTPQDWHSSASEVVQTASRHRNLADTVRQEAQNLSERTGELLQKTQRAVENQFSLRIDDINTHRQYIQRTVDEVYAEISAAQNHKEIVEKELLAKELPLEIAKENLKLREGRQGIDLVADSVEAELNREVTLIEQVKQILKGKMNELVEDLRLLRAGNHQLNEDLKDKNDAKQIDGSAAALNTTSKSIGFFPNSTRVESKSVLPDDWKQFTTENITRAQKQVANSVALREQIDAIIKDTSNKLFNQGNATDGAFNVRISQYTDALTADNQNLGKTQKSITSQEKLIKSMEDLIAERQLPLKLAHTRLEQRTARPNVELVRDSLQSALTAEVGQLNQTQEQLQSKLDEANASLRALNRAEAALKEDINIKNNSLRIDNRCMLQRQQYKYRA